MNTRLQVEHPVTELVTGLDLVRLQLEVAMGRPLPVDQDDIHLDGHAIEARIYAEDAFHGFLPQAGVAEFVRWSDRARNDVALQSGQEVSSAYDPMLGKVIVHGPDREAARNMLVAALDDTAILGLTTNLGFVRSLAGGAAFRDCEIDTAWLDVHADSVVPEGHHEAAVFAVWAIAAAELLDRPGDPFGTADGWRLSGPAAPATIDLVDDGVTARWSVSWRRVVGPDGAVPTRLISHEGAWLRLEIDGRIRSAAVSVGHRRVDVVHRGTTFTFGRPDPFAPDAAVQGDDLVLAPMPGTLLAVEVSVGDEVSRGAALGVLEAMKMELTLKAPFTGRVAEVGGKAGEQITMGALLFRLEATDA
jgi:acetyl/propionyl-CoA carboxylase alpha subunit